MKQVRDRFLEGMRVVILAGVATGIVVVGLGSRLAMFVLRITSPDRVVGVESDDGFEIGRLTLGGTYNLVMLGAIVGVIGAVVYRLVVRWLIGPVWFRRLTTGLAAGVVAGSMLIHSDGIDFTLLQPTWLAIALFIALPALFAVAVGVAVDRVSRPDSWTRRGHRRWVLPLVAVAVVPLIVPFLLFPAVVVGIGALAGEVEGWERLHGRLPYSLIVRAAWLLVAGLGLLALVNDVNALT